MTTKRSLPRPIHRIQHKRFPDYVGWCLLDLSLTSSGDIAVSGFNDGTGQTFIDVYSGSYPEQYSDYRDKPKLYYSKEFEKYSDYCRRYISFLEKSEEILCGIGDKLQVFDMRRKNLLRDTFVNGETTSLFFTNGKIFVGLGYSNEVKVFDVNLLQINSIRLKGIHNNDYPYDVSASSDKLFVCLQNEWKALSFSTNNGTILYEFSQSSHTTEEVEPYSIAINEELNFASILYWDEICLYTLHDGKCFLEAEIDSDVCRIRISNEGRVVTGDYFTGEIFTFDMAELFSYEDLKESLALTLQKDEPMRLAHFFEISIEQTDAIATSDTPAKTLLLALEEKGVMQPSNVDRLRDAFEELKINPSCFYVADLFQRTRIRPTPYRRFLVTLSAHLTASSSEHLCDTFNISGQKRIMITSNQNAGLSLLLALDEMGVIEPLTVAALEQPFKKLKLVQAVAKIHEYQAIVEDEYSAAQKEIQLEPEGKTDVFIRYLQKRIRSWYETMTPVPWKKSCKWKSTDLFVGSGLVLTDSKVKRSRIDIDEQCKLEYTEIFSHDRLKAEDRIILEGEPGSGKTMLMSQLAYDWCQGKFSEIKMLILLPLKFVQQRTITEAIKDFYLPEDSFLSVNDIHGFIHDSKNQTHLLLDGLEEYTGVTRVGELSEIVQIMSKVKYPTCKVVMSSRSGYANNLPICPMLKLGHFGEAERNSYVDKVFHDIEDQHLDIKKVIHDSSFIVDLCSVPLIFVLTVHNIEIMARLHKDQLDMVSPFMKGVVEILCSVNFPSDETDWQPNESFGIDHLQNRGKEPGGDIEQSNVAQSSAPFQFIKVEQSDKYALDIKLSQKRKDLETTNHPTNIGSKIDNDPLVTLEELAFNGLCRGLQQLSWQRDFVVQNVKNSSQWINSGILVIVEEISKLPNITKNESHQQHLFDVPKGEDKQPEKIFISGIDIIKGPFKQQEICDISREAPENFKRQNDNVVYGFGQQDIYETSTEDSEFEQKMEPLDKLGNVLGKPESEKDVRSKVGNETTSQLEEKTNDASDDISDTYRENASNEVQSDRILTQVSLQVRFLHKLIQEWFAANHFSSILWESKKSHLLQECLNKHLPYILPADVHYILRFTCFLCPPSFHLIGKHLLHMYHAALIKKQEYVINCVFLCFLEYRGEQGADFIEFLAELCQETISIYYEDSTLLQKAKYKVLELASRCWIPIKKLLLTDLVVSASEDVITFNTGVLMKPLDTLEMLEISRWDQVLKEEEYPCIIKFISKFHSLKEARLHFPHQPPKLDTETVNRLHREEITVTWVIGPKLNQTLDARTGIWVMTLPWESKFRSVPRQVGEASQATNTLQIQEDVSKGGGELLIPDANVSLKIPPDALDNNESHYVIQMRIIPPSSHDNISTSFSSISSLAVELLPNNLKLKHPAQLTLPHCLQLHKNVEYKARIFMSHHEGDAELQWEEVTEQQYILDENCCTIWLKRFCWVKYEIDDEIVEAKKIKVFTAAKPLCLPDNIAEIEVGYHLDLPGAGEFLQQNPDFRLDQRKSFLFLKEGNYPLKVLLQRIIPQTWHHSAPEENLKEIPFQAVATSIEYSCPFVLEQVTKGYDIPICTFKTSQEQIDMQLNVRPKSQRLVSSSLSSHSPSAEAHHYTGGDIDPDLTLPLQSRNSTTRQQEGGFNVGTKENPMLAEDNPSRSLNTMNMEDPQQLLTFDYPSSNSTGMPDLGARPKITGQRKQNEGGYDTASHTVMPYQQQGLHQTGIELHHQMATYHEQQMLIQRGPCTPGYNTSIQYYDQHINISPYGTQLRGYENMHTMIGDGGSSQGFSLRYETVKAIARKLDPNHTLGNDWRQLADKLGFTMEDITIFENSRQGPTFAVIDCAVKSGKLTSLHQLKSILEDMRRSDAAAVVPNEDSN